MTARLDGWYPPSDGDDITAEMRQAGETAAVVAILLVAFSLLLVAVAVALWGPAADAADPANSQQPAVGSQAWT